MRTAAWAPEHGGARAICHSCYSAGLGTSGGCLETLGTDNKPTTGGVQCSTSEGAAAERADQHDRGTDCLAAILP